MIFKKIGKYMILLSSVGFIQMLLFLIFAKAIESSVLQFSSSSDLILVSVIISIAIIGFVAVSKSGDIKVPIKIAVLYFLIIVLLSLPSNGFQDHAEYYLKLLISIFCGEIIGILFGNHRFHRNMKRRVRSHK